MQLFWHLFLSFPSRLDWNNSLASRFMGFISLWDFLKVSTSSFSSLSFWKKNFLFSLCFPCVLVCFSFDYFFFLGFRANILFSVSVGSLLCPTELWIDSLRQHSFQINENCYVTCWFSGIYDRNGHLWIVWGSLACALRRIVAWFMVFVELSASFQLGWIRIVDLTCVRSYSSLSMINCSCCCYRPSSFYFKTYR